MGKTLIISSSGLKNIVLNKYQEEDFIFGKMLANGEGIQQDLEEAASYYKKSCRFRLK